MVSAVLHARSRVQVVHVVIAALKRAGHTNMAEQESHDQQEHPISRSTSAGVALAYPVAHP